MVKIPSPAVAIVGRHNSGKTTLIVKLIAELVDRGNDVGSIKHHSHVGFDIDVPGKDSYRHREAGASETYISAPGQIACVKTVPDEMECTDIVALMPGHDIIVVEGYRKSGLPTIEIMRAGNPADAATAAVFAECAQKGMPLGSDFTQLGKGTEAFKDFSDGKVPTADTVAVVTDIPEAIEAAKSYGIPSFALEDIKGLADFIEARYLRSRMTVVIQAGGESRRMGRSKATVPFAGRPLICRMVERLSPVADDLVITTNEPDNLAFLHTEFPDLHIKLVMDAFEKRGALPGLYTALEAASTPIVAVVACDMVFASAALIVAESIELKHSGADIVVPVNKHGYEPFHAVYRRMTCLPVIREFVKRGEARVQSFYSSVTVSEFPQSRVLDVEPRGRCFINANTPEELQALEKLVLRSPRA